jgi:hypothetical protein
MFSAVAVIAIIVLAGLLNVPPVFIFYGGGRRCHQRSIYLGMLILCQSAALRSAKLFRGKRSK